MAFAVLIEAVTVVVAPAASVPLVLERVSQLTALPTVQLIVPVPLFESVQVMLEGE